MGGGSACTHYKDARGHDKGTKNTQGQYCGHEKKYFARVPTDTQKHLTPKKTPDNLKKVSMAGLLILSHNSSENRTVFHNLFFRVGDRSKPYLQFFCLLIGSQPCSRLLIFSSMLQGQHFLLAWKFGILNNISILCSENMPTNVRQTNANQCSQTNGQLNVEWP